MVFNATFNNISVISWRMVSLLALSVVDRGFEPRSFQTKDYKIGICCFSAKHTALRSNNKHRLARNRDKVAQVGRHVYLQTVFSAS